MKKAAGRLDSFGLKERMLTAYENLGKEDGFALLQRRDAFRHYEKIRGEIRISLLPDKRHTLALFIAVIATVGIGVIPSPVRERAELLHQVQEEAEAEKEELEELLETLEGVDMESLTDSGAALLTTILTVPEDDMMETGSLPELPITDSMVEGSDVHDEEILNDTEGTIISDKESDSVEEILSDEIISSGEIAGNDTDIVDIETSTDESAALLTEVLTEEVTDNEDTVYTEDYVLTDIMAEENSSNMDESTDLQAMLMVQELSGSEDNNICSNDMENNIYEMPLFTEQFAVAE